MPQPGTQQATSVERERGDQVEEQQHRVGTRQPSDASFDKGRAASRIKRKRRDAKQDREDEADERPGNRDLDLGSRSRGVTPEARDAAEDPERDAIHLHA